MLIAKIMDILIIIGLVFLIYRLIRKTEAIRILYGLLIIVLIYFIASLFGFTNTAYIFKKIFDISSIGIVVIFHKEIRMMLKKIGGITDLSQESKGTVSSIEDAVFNMAESKTGALIIFDPEGKVTFQAEDMVRIDAICTGELLETIFFKNSVLHDGAVIIQDGRITYAGCKLPLTGQKREEYGNLGTRHLAALETAEMFDVIGIVVSEEKGKVSIATNKGIREIENREMFNVFFREKVNNPDTLAIRKVLNNFHKRKTNKCS